MFRKEIYTIFAVLNNQKNYYMENTLKYKEMFFAQHYGQKVQVDSELKGKYPLTISNISFEPEKCHLKLKRISKISRKDLYFIGVLFGFEDTYGIQHENVYHRAGSIIKDLFYHPDSHCELKRYLQLFDYLRSKGYAIPWMGLSVETMVEYGWIKLKK